MKRLVLASTLLVVSCLPEESVTTDEVVHVALCPAEGPACDATNLLADGATLIGVEVSTPAAERPDPLDATLIASSGTWVVQSGAASNVVTVSLAGTPRRIVALRPPASVGPLQIDARLGGFTATIFATLHGAPLSPPALEVSPGSIGPDNTVRVIAHVRAAGAGSHSVGTYVQFSVSEVAPAGGVAFLSPPVVTCQQDGTAATALYVTSSVTSATIAATALPPDATSSTAQSSVTIGR